MRIIALLLLASIAIVCPSQAQTVVNPTYRFADRGLRPQTNKWVVLTPFEAMANWGSTNLTAAPMSGLTDTNGSITFSNVPAGYSYIASLATPYSTTYITNGYPVGLNGNVNASDYQGVWANQVFALFNQKNGALVVGTNSFSGSNFFTGPFGISAPGFTLDPMFGSANFGGGVTTSNFFRGDARQLTNITAGAFYFQPAVSTYLQGLDGATTNYIADFGAASLTFQAVQQSITGNTPVNYLYATNGPGVLDVRIIATGNITVRFPTNWSWINTNGFGITNGAYSMVLSNGQTGLLEVIGDLSPSAVVAKFSISGGNGNQAGYAIASNYGTAALSNAASFYLSSNPSNYDNSPLYIRASGPSPFVAGIAYYAPSGLNAEGTLLESSTDGTNWVSFTPTGAWNDTNFPGMRDQGFWYNTSDGYFYIPNTYQTADLNYFTNAIGIRRSSDLSNLLPVGRGFISVTNDPDGTPLQIWSPDFFTWNGTNYLYFSEAPEFTRCVKCVAFLDNTFTNVSAPILLCTNEVSPGSGVNDPFIVVTNGTVCMFAYRQGSSLYDLYTNNVFPAVCHLAKTNATSFGMEAADILQLPNGLWRLYGAWFTIDANIGRYFYVDSPTFGSWTTNGLNWCGQSTRKTFGQSTVLALTGANKTKALNAIVACQSNAPSLNAPSLKGLTTANSLGISNRVYNFATALTYSGVTNAQVDCAANNIFTLSVTTNTYFPRPLNIVPGQCFTVMCQQDTVGTHPIAFDTNYWLFANPTGTFTTNANTVDIFDCVSDSYGSAIIVKATNAIIGAVSPVGSAFAAYSIRKMDPGYTGFCMKIRRSSDNLTQNIGFVGNNGDTNSAVSFCAGGNGFVDTWYDQSGHGRDVNNTVLANQPKFISSGLLIGGPTNSASIDFSSGKLFTANAITFSTAMSVYCVVSRPWSAGNYAGIVGINYSSSGGFGYLVGTGASTWPNLSELIVGNGYLSPPNTWGAISGLTDNTWHLMSGIIGAANSGVFKDATSFASTTVNGIAPASTAVMYIGGFPSGEQLDGKMSEVIIYQDNHAAAVQTIIRNRANAYFLLY